MIGAPNTRGQKYWVGIVQWAPETSVSEERADIFRNYNMDSYTSNFKTCDLTGPFQRDFAQYETTEVVGLYLECMLREGQCNLVIDSWYISCCPEMNVIVPYWW